MERSFKPSNHDRKTKERERTMNLQTIAGPNNNSEGKSVQYATDKCHDALRFPQQALAKQKIP